MWPLLSRYDPSPWPKYLCVLTLRHARGDGEALRLFEHELAVLGGAGHRGVGELLLEEPDAGRQRGLGLHELIGLMGEEEGTRG